MPSPRDTSELTPCGLALLGNTLSNPRGGHHFHTNREQWQAPTPPAASEEGGHWLGRADSSFSGQDLPVRRRLRDLDQHPEGLLPSTDKWQLIEGTVNV